jgi:hypothetical protein
MTASQRLAPLLIDAKREKLWPQNEARAPHFVKWQARTGRMFPIVPLTIRHNGSYRSARSPPRGLASG